jgi:hypothetical protein
LPRWITPLILGVADRRPDVLLGLESIAFVAGALLVASLGLLVGAIALFTIGARRLGWRLGDQGLAHLEDLRLAIPR